MKKSNKIFMWVLIGIITLLIIYVLFINKGEPSLKQNLLTPPSNNSNEAPVVIPAPVTVSDSNFSIGQSIYAAGDIVNTYTSCSPSSTNISATYKKGDLIGAFLRKENFCIVLAVETTPFGISWIPIKGSEEVYLPTNALVYKG